MAEAGLAEELRYGRKKIIDVEQKVLNDVDSGFGGNNWAFDNLQRKIEVYTQTDGSFCAVVNYHGTFDAQAGQLAPGMGASNILNGSEDGRFDGGYRGVITGTLKANPAWRTRGMVGTTDYMCNIAGACPGYVSWMAQYFDAPQLHVFVVGLGVQLAEARHLDQRLCPRGWPRLSWEQRQHQLTTPTEPQALLRGPLASVSGPFLARRFPRRL